MGDGGRRARAGLVERLSRVDPSRVDLSRVNLSWADALLAIALVALVGSSVLYDRSGWPDLLRGEATSIMQAESLAHDLDLGYDRLDFDRLLLARIGEPPDLALSSGSDGREIAFDRPFPHALFLAPFLRLAPDAGWAVAHALALALAAWLAAAGLRRRLGPDASLWVLVLLFASVAWIYVFFALAEVFFFAAALAAAGLIVGDPDGDRPRRWLGVGLLLSLPAAAQAIDGVLVLAALVAAPTAVARLRVGAGAVGGLLLQALVRWWSGAGLLGGWLGERLGVDGFRFTRETGFPLVDFPATAWTTSVTRFEALHFVGAPKLSWGLEPLLWAWNTVYLLCGESIGLLPYFAPLLLVLVGRDGRGAKAWGLAAALWAILVLFVHPFDLFGGETAVANRRVLPLFGLLPIAFGHPGPRRLALIAPAGIVAVAALFLLPSWSDPWAYPLAAFDDRAGAERRVEDSERSRPPGSADARRTGTTPRFAHVGAVARAVLPYETSQRPLPGGPMTRLSGLSVRFLDEQAWFEETWERFRMEGDARVDLLVAAHRDPDVLRLTFRGEAPSALRVTGAALGETVLTPDGGIAFRLLPGAGRRHATWWSPRRQTHHRISFAFEAGPEADLAFRLIPEYRAPSEAEDVP